MAAPEAQLLGHNGTEKIKATAAVTSGEVIKMAAGDNRAAIVTGLNLGSVVSGDLIEVVTSGTVRLKKLTAVTIALGAQVFWDITANTAISASMATGDFRCGHAIEAGASSDLFVDVALNAMVGTLT